MTPDHEMAPMKRRSFVAAATAGLAGLFGITFLRRPEAHTPVHSASVDAGTGKMTRISIHPLAVRRNEKAEKKHG